MFWNYFWSKEYSQYWPLSRFHWFLISLFLQLSGITTRGEGTIDKYPLEYFGSELASQYFRPFGWINGLEYRWYRMLYRKSTKTGSGLNLFRRSSEGFFLQNNNSIIFAPPPFYFSSFSCYNKTRNEWREICFYKSTGFFLLHYFL